MTQTDAIAECLKICCVKIAKLVCWTLKFYKMD